MPKTEVIFYQDENGEAPALIGLSSWLPKVQDKCFVRIERLQELGHELRRPEADTLRDGIHELRVRHLNVNYRLLYFFHDGSAGKVAVLCQALTKEDVVPPKAIDRAVEAKSKFAANHKKHTFEADADED